MTPVQEFKARVAVVLGAGAFKRSALNIRDGGGVFERVLGGGAYRTALEIGTYRGVSAAWMAQFCERVITIDLVHGKRELNGETFDREAFWRAIGVDNIDHYLVEDDAAKARLINQLDFDFAFIDGAHDCGVRDDFDLVKRCGAVLFHDYDFSATPKRNAVFNFVNTLPRHQITVMDIFALWTN